MTRFHFLFGTLMVVTMALPQTNADEPATKASDPVIEVSGVFPRLAMVADHSPRTEAGTGALMPWSDRLWIVSYELAQSLIEDPDRVSVHIIYLSCRSSCGSCYKHFDHLSSLLSA